ncbi:MAG: hypothetical protein RQM92_14845 [Candidatus Syntrophopropionicum ammoniitolerans]
MEINLQQGNTFVTIIGQKNLDKKLLGAKIMLTEDSSEIRGSLQLPWLEEQVVRLIEEGRKGGMFLVADMANPNSPEQKATVMMDLFGDAGTNYFWRGAYCPAFGEHWTLTWLSCYGCR